MQQPSVEQASVPIFCASASTNNGRHRNKAGLLRFARNDKNRHGGRRYKAANAPTYRHDAAATAI